jgi:hypothetical protein
VGAPKVGIFFVVDDHLLLDAGQGDPYGETMGHGSRYEFWDIFVPGTVSRKDSKLEPTMPMPEGVSYLSPREARCLLFGALAEAVPKRASLGSIWAARGLRPLEAASPGPRRPGGRLDPPPLWAERAPGYAPRRPDSPRPGVRRLTRTG